MKLVELSLLLTAYKIHTLLQASVGKKGLVQSINFAVLKWNTLRNLARGILSNGKPLQLVVLVTIFRF